MSEIKESDIVGPKVKAMIIEGAIKDTRRDIRGNDDYDRGFRDGYGYAMDSIMQYAEDLKNKNAG